MPAEQSHYLFLLDCLEQAAGPAVSHAAGQLSGRGPGRSLGPGPGPDFDLEALVAGTQGPDPFFFYGRLPWARRRDIALVERFADIMHKEDPPRHFRALEERARGESDRESRRTCLSFVAGLRLHYILDETLHPYVFARQAACARERMAIVDSPEGLTDRETAELTGFLDPRSPVDQDYYLSHHRFEARLAMALHQWRRPALASAAGGSSARAGSPAPRPLAEQLRFHPREFLPKSRRMMETADSLMASVPAATGEILSPGMFATAWADMAFVLRLVYDPRGHRARLLDFLGAEESLLRNFMQPAAMTRSARSFFLNLSVAPWQDHRTPAGPRRTESVPELYEAALSAGRTVLEDLGTALMQ